MYSYVISDIFAPPRPSVYQFALRMKKWEYSNFRLRNAEHIVKV